MDQIEDLKRPAYAVSQDWLIDALAVDPEVGLSDAAVTARRAEFGLNAIGTVRETSWSQILVNQFRGAVVWLLLAAAALSLWMQDLPEAVAILVVLVVNGGIGFATEARAAKSMQALRKLTHTSARIRRAGRVERFDAEEIVPGDIVLLEAGDVVPADIRMVAATDLNVDESALTGESVPVSKSTEAIAGAVPLADRANMVFRGTSVTRGSGIGITTATGQRTQLGEISELVAGATSESTPLERRLDQLGRHLAFAALAVSAGIALLGFLGGRSIVDMVGTAIALAVAAVPEGLPIVATLALARGMWRMAARNVLINRLSAVETLGSANVLLTDKTGTLTENRMAVAEILFADAVLVPGEPGDAGAARLMSALSTMALCNDAVLGSAPDGDEGDPMEIALLRAVRDLGADPAALAADHPRLRSLAFDPDIKMMATVNCKGRGSVAHVKGAPEAVLAASSKALLADGTAPMTPERRTALDGVADEAADRGFRMLGLAERPVETEIEDPYQDLTFIGFVGLRDPARPDVAAAIGECHRAGVRVIMVTGDHKVTARRIARDVGLVTGDGAEVCEGTDLTEVKRTGTVPEQLLRADVFARVPPGEKLTLVALHQGEGSVVAMTGDGVNDAPALRKADIGIAMGKRGTQVAAEASDVILRDDAFGSIVHAIREGRIIYGNIRAFIRYLFTCNLSEILLIALATASGLPMPLLPLQILFLNLLTDIFPAIALGFGEGGDDVMDQPPRRGDEPLVTRRGWAEIIADGCLISLSALGVFIYELERTGPEAASGAAFLTICLAQLIFVFTLYRQGESVISSQITRNRWVWSAIGLSGGLMLAGTFVPALSTVLRLVPPDQTGWILVLGGSVLPTLLIVARRMLGIA